MSGRMRGSLVGRAAAVAALLTLSAGAAAPRTGTEGVVVAGSIWGGQVNLKAKVAGPGGSNSIGGPVLVALTFGPGPFLAPGEFAIAIDDGVDVLGFEGEYVEPVPGKVQLLPSPSSYENAWCGLFFDTFGVDDCDFDSNLFKATAKIKSTPAGDTLRLKFGAKSNVTISVAGETGTAKLKVGVKGLMTPD